MGACIKTEPKPKKLRIGKEAADRIRRVKRINRILKAVIKKYQVNYIVSELPHGSQSAAAATSLGLISGAVQSMSDFLDIPIEWYSEGDSKKALLGKLTATKEETIIAVSKLYDVKWAKVKYKDEAVADAISVYVAALKHSPYLKTVIKTK